MRRMLAVLAMAALAACSDQPTQPNVDTPQFAQWGAANGAWTIRFGPENGCGFWDASGNLIGPEPCSLEYTPGGNFGFKIWSTGRIANATGRAVRFDATHYPPSLEEAYVAGYGLGATNGVMPLCDWDNRRYPDPYTAWDLTTLACTTNWHFEISAAGKGMLVATFDRAHTFYPFATP